VSHGRNLLLRIVPAGATQSLRHLRRPRPCRHRDDGAHSLLLDYDAERLASVHAATGSPLQAFNYHDTNAAGFLRGNLEAATR